MTTAGQYKELPLTEIHESKHNPRRHFNEDTLVELVESIRKVGVITPALVRPRPAGGYELAAGHRRYRASKVAGQPTLPCIVREMDDQAFMEVLTIENLQREDVHPLDEAKGYEALMAAPYKMDVEKIAQRIGKSVKYIYDRVKLLALCKEAQDLFWSGQIEAGHAILLARLTPDEQKKVIGNQEEALNFIAGGLFQEERVLFGSDDERDAFGDKGPLKAVSVRELDRWIKEHIRFKAEAADPFLFPDTVEKVGEARHAKIKVIEITREYRPDDHIRNDDGGRVFGQQAWKRADGKADSRTCDRSVMGVVSCGPGQGEAFFVCINKEKCLIHWGAEIKAREQRQKAKASCQAPAVKPASAKKSDWQIEQERQQAREERWAAVCDKVRGDIRAKIEKMAIGSILSGYLGKALINDLKGWNARPAMMAEVPAGKTAESFLRHLCWVMVVNDLDSHGRAERHVKGLGFSMAELLKKYAPEQKPATVQTAAVKGKKKTKAA